MYSQKLVGSDYKIASVITGIFFIVATVSAILGLKLYDPLLSAPNYLTSGYQNKSSIIGGATSELFTSCANIGTAVMLYPLLRRFNESIGIGYVCFRFLEVVFIIIGIVSMLSLLSLSTAFTKGTITLNQAEGIGLTLKATYKWCFLLGPNFMLGINTSLYSYVLYKTELIPRSIAWLGLAGAILIFIVAFLQILGAVAPMSSVHVVMSIPIAVYEMVLAGYLIIKGYTETGIERLNEMNVFGEIPGVEERTHFDGRKEMMASNFQRN
jgi:hypothetical protein